MSVFRPRTFGAGRPGPAELLRLTTSWCLEHLPPQPSHVVGVVPNDLSVSFQTIELGDVDALGELSTLVAPHDWEALLFSGHRIEITSGRFVFGLHRSGLALLQIRFDDGTVATSTDPASAGRLSDVCREVLRGRPAAAS